MKNKILYILTLFIFSASLAGCSESTDEESVVYGDINENIEYNKEDSLKPSAVERKDKVDINDYFLKIPISITQEKVSSTLPDVYGNNYNIDRIQLNNVYFDINEIANKNNYNYFVEDGFFKINVPIEEEKSISISVAQIASGDTYTIPDDSQREISNIIEEYREIYENTQNQTSDEYGDYYTYSEYINYLNNHEEYKKDITVYDKTQILELLLNIFDLSDYTVDDFLSNNNCQMIEYSTWYEVTNNYYSAKDSDYALTISVRRNTEGVFATLIKYPYNCTVDNISGEDYFTPAMIVNFAQNNYWQSAESYNDYVERNNFQNE